MSTAQQSSAAVLAYNDVMEHASAVASKVDPAAPRVVPNDAPSGSWARQGDIYIHIYDINTEIPKMIPARELKAQLAPGNSKGSRHVIEDMSGVVMFEIEGANALQGPVFKTLRQTTISHPEHVDIVVPANRIVVITYQRAMAEELRAVRD